MRVGMLKWVGGGRTGFDSDRTEPRTLISMRKLGIELKRVCRHDQHPVRMHAVCCLRSDNRAERKLPSLRHAGLNESKASLWLHCECDHPMM